MAPMSRPSQTSWTPPANPPVATPFWAWLLLGGLLVAAMVWLRLVLYPHRVVPLAYGLPLLIGLLHRDLRLHYGMAIAFSGVAIYKLFGLLPKTDPDFEIATSGLMLVNIWTVACVVHALIRAHQRMAYKRARLEQLNTELEASNAELVSREEEISRQNEELQSQAEELEQQAEELRQQTEELEQQTTELQTANDELARREKGLQTLLESARWLRSDLGEHDVAGAICHAAVQVLEEACAAAVVQERGGRVWMRGHYGFGIHGTMRQDCEFNRSFASLVMEQGRSAYLADVTTRPDLQMPQPLIGPPLRSVLAAPVWMEGRVVAAIEVYSQQPRQWTDEQFRVVEWLAAQTALALQALQYHRELELKRREAEEASIQKTRFMAAVSHDVRTPANAISLMADLIQQTAADPATMQQVPKLVSDLRGSARALVELVSDVLDLARLDTGRLDLEPSEFCLNSLVETEVRQHQPVAQGKGLKLETILPEQPVWVRTDKMKLARVLSNLVGNAIKFTDVGHVQVRVGTRADGVVEVVVADTGVGIAPEHLTRIFDEFHQLRNPERDRSKGTGLGLAICRRLVDGLGCSIAVESTLGRGTSFSVRLPAELRVEGGDARPDDASAQRAKPPAATASHQRLAGRRVLLVEDHDLTRRAAAQLLCAHGATVFQAATGKAALHVAAHEHPDVMLLDLMLPDMDGADVLRQVHLDRPASLRCVLAVSGDVRDDRVSEVRRLGADGLVAKPLNMEDLLGTIERHFTGPHNAAARAPAVLLDRLPIRGMPVE